MSALSPVASSPLPDPAPARQGATGPIVDGGQTVRPAAAGRPGRWGVWLSVACAVHCLALPVMAVALPQLAHQWEALEGAEWAFPLLTIALIAGQLLPAARRTGQWAPTLLACGGVALALTALLTEEALPAAHLPLMLGAAGLTLTGFWRHYRLAHRACPPLSRS